MCARKTGRRTLAAALCVACVGLLPPIRLRSQEPRDQPEWLQREQTVIPPGSVYPLSVSLSPSVKQKLRAAAQMPRLAVTGGIPLLEGMPGWPGWNHFAGWDKKPDMSADISAARKDMHGDVSDAERYYRLGQLYDQALEAKAALEAYGRAVDLYLQQLQVNRDDPRTLAQLAMALTEVDKAEEAEVVSRRAIKKSAGEWTAWISLARALHSRAQSLLLRATNSANYYDVDAVLSHRRQVPAASPDQVAAIEKKMDEAKHCFDEAIKLAPGEFEAYSQRAAGRAARTYGECILRALQGDKRDWRPTYYAMAFLAPESVQDLKAMSKLNPDDVRATAAAVVAEVFAYPGLKSQYDPDGSIWKALPDDIRESAVRGMQNLKRLTESKDCKTAASAWEALGLSQMMILGSFSDAAASFRQAIRLDPSRDQAWEMLTAVLAVSEQHKEVLAVSQELVKHKDSPRNRMLLAIAYWDLDQLDKAEEQIRAALKPEPKDTTASLWLAALLLKRGDDAVALKSAGRILQEQAEAVRTGRSREAWLSHAINTGVYLGLIGRSDLAERWLKAALQQDKDNEHLRDALSALQEQK
jgi:tetratricopeptide (TPR) repeat protein